jgi:predicted heme/steroid binding protein
MKRALIIAGSLLIALTMVGAALLYTPTAPREKTKAVSRSELAQRDGINGHECWVAVDGKVYAISGFSQWQMGRHLPSNGKASCGRDLSAVILESPHGKSTLQLLKVVGTYKP